MGVLSPNSLVPVATTNAENNPRVLRNGDLLHPCTIHSSDRFREREGHVQHGTSWNVRHFGWLLAGKDTTYSRNMSETGGYLGQV